MPLVLKNFDKQSVISTSDVKHYVEQLPTKHIKSLTHIVYDPTRFFQRSYSNPSVVNQNVLGEYNQLPQNFVTIYKFNNRKEFLHLLYHEIGHHVFNKILSVHERREWVLCARNSRHHVSEYAKTNTQEDFCESYAFFMHSKHILARDSHKINFMRQVFR